MKEAVEIDPGTSETLCVCCDFSRASFNSNSPQSRSLRALRGRILNAYCTNSDSHFQNSLPNQTLEAEHI